LTAKAQNLLTRGTTEPGSTTKLCRTRREQQENLLKHKVEPNRTAEKPATPHTANDGISALNNISDST